MWSERIDQLKRLRRAIPADTDQIPVTDLRRDDRFRFAGDWFRVLGTAAVDDHQRVAAGGGKTKTIIDYWIGETVTVALPRPPETT